MEWIYKLLPNYGWDIILFTLLINIVKIPLQLSQQGGQVPSVSKQTSRRKFPCLQIVKSSAP